MLLKSLEIQGFKSFPDKTRITFDRGLTAVVGPNGSGKSNISDAVRWVMGEQSTKNLRGAKMEDVIFTGTKARKSQGFAEVSLVIDNADRTLAVESDEVIITRKYYRSGESEYQINRAGVRLRDINELLMDTGLGRDGYAMVGQGRIAEIVQSKSEQRREIFEEAAGISKYRYRKNEAERKLRGAEENLLRLMDILNELEERVGPLKEQSEKAKRFLELSEEKKTLEVSVWVHSLTQANRTIKDQGDRILARRLEQEELEQAALEKEEEIQSVYDRMQQCLVAIDELRRSKEELDARTAALTAEIAVCENDIRHNQENANRVAGELVSFGESGNRLAEKIKARTLDIDTFGGKLQKLDAAITRQETELLELGKKTDHFSFEAKRLTDSVNALLVEQSQNKLLFAQIQSRSESEAARFAENQETISRKKKDISSYEAELTNAKSLLGSIGEKEQSLHNAASGCQMKYDHRRQGHAGLLKRQSELDLKIKEINQKARLLSDLEKNLEGFAYSVKAVLRQTRNGVLSGILGTVSQLLDARQEYATAIEIALGGMMQHIVVENEGCAKGAIRHLKQENAGRATFLPITSVKGRRLDTSSFEEEEGYIALACDLVTYDSKYEGIVYSLLGRIAVVDDLDTAVMIAKRNGYRFKIVTLDGQVVNAGGSMSGGSNRGKSQGILSRKTEIASLQKEAVNLEKKLGELELEGKEYESELSGLKAQLTAINSEIITLGEDKIRAEGEAKRLTLFLESENAQIEVMEQELTVARQKLEEDHKTLSLLKDKDAAVEKNLTQSRQELASMEGEHSGLDETQKEITEELNSLRLKRVEAQKDLENAEEGLSVLQERDRVSTERKAALEQQKAGFAENIEASRSKINSLEAEISRLKEESAAMEAQSSAQLEQRNALEMTTTQLRTEERSLSAAREKVTAELARFEERLSAVQRDYDVIINKLWEEYQMTRSEADAFAMELEDIREAEKSLQSLRGRIRALGSVNVAAIEEYQEVAERYEFLCEQLDDVERSKRELLRLVEELTGKMRSIFEESFGQINTHFQRIFVELFGGGQARLSLTEPDNILESGIEIFVEPPGKIIKNLSLLSGGEQAFVAIAIYFAILNVRPAPFCVLDEIEAALDDVNVNRYAEYLRLMSGNTQFIMITHRRGTMEEADVLYGVTMQEEGVSKLLRLDVSEVERQLGKLDE